MNTPIKEVEVKIKKLCQSAKLPFYATDGSGCFDIYSLHKVGFKKQSEFSTGLCFEIPVGYVMLVYSRSGQAFKKDTRLANCVAVIDSDYRGELKIKLTCDHPDANIRGSGIYQYIEAGQAIAQGMIVPIPQTIFVEVETLSETIRGNNGFGSTDKIAEDVGEDKHFHESEGGTLK